MDLHWLPVTFRIKFKDLFIVFKALNGLAPYYITKLIIINSPSSYSIIKSNSKFLLQKTRCKTLPTQGARSFGCAVPDL